MTFIKKQNIDLLITAGNISIGKSAVPQVVIMHDRNSLKKSFKILATGKQADKGLGTIHFFRACRPSFAVRNKTAETILYTGKYSHFKNPGAEAKEIIKDKFASGHEYFLYVTANRKDPHFKILLKAFSVFRKWQRSSMMMLIVCQDGSTPEFPELTSYLHRDFVKLTGLHNKGDYEMIVGSAYAGINFTCNGLSDPLVEMMHTGVPAITADNADNRNWFDESCLYCKTDADSLAQQLIQLYKDETLRSLQIGRGSKTAVKWSLENAARGIMETGAPAIFS